MAENSRGNSTNTKPLITTVSAKAARAKQILQIQCPDGATDGKALALAYVKRYALARTIARESVALIQGSPKEVHVFQ
jgi:hypothetical protein